MLLGDISANNARRYPNKRALVDGDRVLSWAQVDERARRLANHLVGSGLSVGDRVLVIARNCIEWPEISFGLAKAGLVTAPVNVRLAADEVAHLRDDSGARGAIIHADHVEKFGDLLTGLGPVLVIGGQPARCRARQATTQRWPQLRRSVRNPTLRRTISR